MKHEKYGKLNIVPARISADIDAMEYEIVSECHYQKLSFIKCVVHYNVNSDISLAQTAADALNLKIEEFKSALSGENNDLKVTIK